MPGKTLHTRLRMKLREKGIELVGDATPVLLYLPASS